MSTTSLATSSAEQLSAAFAEFEDASRELSGFYAGLEQQVALLTRELACSRQRQASEFAEKERLAARLENLLEALPGGVVVLDADGCVQEFNPVAHDLLGAMRAGESWVTIVARAFAPRWDDGHDVSLTDGRRVNIATQSLSGEPGQILLLTEVTETRRLIEQLEHHKRLSAKTEMAAALAHQIRTPLSSALLTLGNIRAAPSEAFRNRALQSTLGSMRRLERLVEEMLLFARGGQFELSEIGSDDLLAAIASACDNAVSLADFAIEIARPADSVAVYANPDALVSVAMNLIENSHQADPIGQLKIDLAVSDEAVQLRFADSGPGIHGLDRERVFEPFHSMRKNGTGLGLPVARSVARAHGGDLYLAEAAIGACFVLTLPRVTLNSPGDLDALAETTTTPPRTNSLQVT